MEDLYRELLSLSHNDDTPFFFAEARWENEFYRIFSYHFTDKDSWLLPSALESRGIMFEVAENGDYIRLASRPMQKFFNKGEVDFIEYTDIDYVMNKADGSLISSYTTSNNDIRLKSKTSIHSEYAQLAMDLLFADIEMYDFVKWCERDGYTVNMELVSPDPKFRIVLYYDQPKLIVLNVRHRTTGEYMDVRSIPDGVRFAGVVDKEVLNYLDTASLIEGYVAVDKNGNWWKEKCDWYLARHRAKDFVNQPRAFVELVLKDEADDVFTLIADQVEVHAEMLKLQHDVITKANTIVNHVTTYWKDNKHMSRKDYAIKGKSELETLHFALAMSYYGKDEEPNWNEFLLKQVKNIEWQ